MEKFENIQNPENQEKYGQNVHVKMLFMRHGEKASEAGLLSEAGKRKLQEQFQNYPQTSDKIKLSTANVGRNIQTLRIIEDSIKDEKLGTSHIDTAYGYFSEKLGGITDHQKEVDFSDDFVDRLHELIRTGEENDVVQSYIDFQDQRPDQDTISPKEMASKIAKRVLVQSKIAKRLYSGSKVDFIQITGSTPFFPLLKELISDEVDVNPVNPEGKNFTEKIGGTWDFGEGVTIEANTNEHGELQPLKVSFRGKEYVVDLDQLTELAKSEEISPRKYKLSNEVV